jgi:hypothetical protein
VQQAGKKRAVAGPHRAVFMVIQGFAWESRPVLTRLQAAPSGIVRMDGTL